MTSGPVPRIERTAPPEQRKAFEKIWDNPKGISGLVREVNNIPIAHRYMATGFAFFLAGGLLALLMRIQLGTPENTFLDAETYNQIFTMHGTTMMFLFVIPFIEALATYLLPLLLGTRDLPFPRLTALSYWTYLFGGLLLYSSFLFGLAPDGGWFAYPPLTDRQHSPGLNLDFWDIGLSVAEIAALGAAAEIIVSVLRMRAPGMTLARLPLFCWAMLVTAFMIIFAFTPLIVGTLMLELDRKALTSFFMPEGGGEPLLWQHLFWVFGHPEVYIMFIPAAGIVSHVVQAFSRRPVVGHTLLVLSIIATGFISFGLWVHHMFTTGLPSAALGFFTAASMIIAIPNGIQVFAWIATLWSGRPVWRTPLLFVIGFLVIFVIGGLTGVMVAAVPFDWQVHDTYFLVAHFHYVLIGGVIFPLFAGLYYWLPKVTGRQLSETLGKWNFWMMFVFFNVAFFPMHISGLLGMPRRVYTFPEGLGLEPYNLISTLGGAGFAVGVLLFVVNVARSFRGGQRVGSNPWSADSLEWSETSPPAAAQFAVFPVVRSRHPMWDQETLDPEDPALARQLRALDWAPTEWRGGLAVSVVDAEPKAVVQIPTTTIVPFVMAVGFLLLFAGLIVENTPITAVGSGVIAIAGVMWFWPTDLERKAIEEWRAAPDDGRPPLAVAGPDASGYWGAIVLILVLATALVTGVASFFYLSDGPREWPPSWSTFHEQLAMPVIVTAILIVGALATWMMLRGVTRERPAGRRIGAAIALVAMLATVWLTFNGFRQAGFKPELDAYASAVLLMLILQWMPTLIAAVLLIVAQVWAWRASEDPRGHGIAHIASLLSWYSVASWLVVGATIWVSPLVW